MVRFDRFAILNIFKSGISYEDTHIVEIGPSIHMTRTGNIHPIDIGKRMKEGQKMIKDAIVADPLRAVPELIINLIGQFTYTF